jgi:hypothetical protein
MHQPAPGQCQMPLPLPLEHNQRIVLRCLRRMAAHGVRDAQGSLWMFEQFGIHYRRPLVLLRAFVIELAQVSQRRIQIAPCCAMRMTLDEGRIVEALAAASDSPATAQRHLRQLTEADNPASPLSLAIAFNDTLAALGKPLAL